ncbi:MAG: nucleotidyltransferase domain-containing protein, partial [Candidatus Aenigmarchaeota archaeon]|nr:nucleotidyltransferase domain-containing protein [Candidatus Aenigmarchaeota archaeon]
MDTYGTIFEHALKKIRPDTKEIVENQMMFDDIKAFIKEKYSLDARLMGSVAKNTFIAGDKDLDIFVFFPIKTKKEDLEEKGLNIGKNVFKRFGGNYVVSYAEHPYT